MWVYINKTSAQIKHESRVLDTPGVTFDKTTNKQNEDDLKSNVYISLKIWFHLQDMAVLEV